MFQEKVGRAERGENFTTVTAITVNFEHNGEAKNQRGKKERRRKWVEASSEEGKCQKKTKKPTENH